MKEEAEGKKGRQEEGQTETQGLKARIVAFCSVASIKQKYIEMIACITPRKSSFKLFDYFFPVASGVIYISWPQFRFFLQTFPSGVYGMNRSITVKG